MTKNENLALLRYAHTVMPWYFGTVGADFLRLGGRIIMRAEFTRALSDAEVAELTHRIMAVA